MDYHDENVLPAIKSVISVKARKNQNIIHSRYPSVDKVPLRPTLNEIFSDDFYFENNGNYNNTTVMKKL